MHTAEPLEPDLSACDFEIDIGKQKSLWSPGINQILTELIEAGCRTFRSEMHKHINSMSNKLELPEVWKESIIVPIYKKGDKTIIIEAYHFCQLHTKFYPTSCCQG